MLFAVSFIILKCFILFIFNFGAKDARIEDYNTPSYYGKALSEGFLPDLCQFTGRVLISFSYLSFAQDIQPAKDVLTPKSTKSEATEDDEPPLNEDDDEDEDDLELGDEEPSINDLVLAQFDKVSPIISLI